MNREDKINLTALIIIIGFFAAVVYHYILGVYFNLPYPYNTFLFIPSDRFNDFFNNYSIFANFNPYYQTTYLANYFPFCFFILYLFILLPKITSFIILNIIFISYFIYFNYKNMMLENKDFNKIMLIKNTFILSFLTYPFLVSVDRGNIEIILFIFVSLFVYFYSKNHLSKAIIFLSFAISMKFYPIIYLALFISDKKYREVIYTLLITLFLSFGSLLFFGRNFLMSTIHLLQHLYQYKMQYEVGNLGLAYGSSIFGAIKVFLYKNQILDMNFMLNDLQIYTYIVLILILFILIYLIFVEKEFWKKITILAFSAIIFPPVSGDYKLLSIFIPFWLFVNNKKPSKYDMFYLISFAILLIPKDYYIISQNVSINVILNPLIMTIMLIILIIEGIIKNRNTGLSMNER